MTHLFKKKTRLEKLKEQYAKLMKISFQTALTSKDKSDKLKKEAEKIYQEIQCLS